MYVSGGGALVGWVCDFAAPGDAKNPEKKSVSALVGGVCVLVRRLPSIISLMYDQVVSLDD